MSSGGSRWSEISNEGHWCGGSCLCSIVLPRRHAIMEPMSAYTPFPMAIPAFAEGYGSRGRMTVGGICLPNAAMPGQWEFEFLKY